MPHFPHVTPAKTAKTTHCSDPSAVHIAVLTRGEVDTLDPPDHNMCWTTFHADTSTCYYIHALEYKTFLLLDAALLVHGYLM